MVLGGTRRSLYSISLAPWRRETRGDSQAPWLGWTRSGLPNYQNTRSANGVVFERDEGLVASARLKLCRWVCRCRTFYRSMTVWRGADLV